MKKGKKLTRWILGSIVVLILLAGALILLGPRLIHSDFAKREIAKHLSQKAGAQVHIAQTDFCFFPRPRVVFAGAALSVPGRVSAEIASITVYPRVWPLLLGRIEIARILAQSPEFTIYLPASDSQQKASSNTPEKDLSNRPAALLAPTMAGVKDLSLQIQNGHIDLVTGDKTLLGVDHIQFLLKPSSQQISLELSGESSLCKQISMKARMDPASRKVEGHVDLNGIVPRYLPVGLIPEGPVRVGNGETSLDLDFKADLSRGLKVDIQGSVPQITLVHRDAQTVLKGPRVAGTVSLKSGGAQISVSRLHLDVPRLDLSGEMAMDSQMSDVHLKLEARDMDIASIRNTVLTLGGDVPDIQEVFDVVRDGQVPLMTVDSHGKSLADLMDMDHLLIDGHLSGGRIFISETKMDLTDISGDVQIKEGILTGTRLQARLKKAFGSNGSLRMGLAGNDPLFHLDMVVKADLTEALPIVEGLIHEGPFLRELRRIDRIQGTATARLILGEKMSSITARVEASEFNLSARYRPIPYLVQASGGRLNYENRMIRAHQVEVDVGQSSFSGLSGTLNWRGESFLEMEGHTCTIVLDEIYPWLTSLNGAGDALRELSGLKGLALVNALDFKGPLLRPGSWRFNVNGRIRDVILSAKRFPGPLNLREGIVRADANTIAFEGARLDMMDARLSLSGMATGYMKGVSRLKTTVDGHVGKEAARWVSKIVVLPDYIRLRTPIAIREGRFAWNKSSGISFQGDLTVEDGPRISLRGVRTPSLFNIQDLRISDETSHARCRFRKEQDAIGFGFSGNLTRTCLDSLLIENRFMTGWIEGDLWGRVIPGRPIESTIEGQLKGGRISLRQLGLPARIDTFSLQGSQQQLQFRSDMMALDERQIGVEADLNLSEQGILFRLDVAADGINLKRTKAALEKLASTSEDGKRHVRWSVPVKGTAHIQLDRLEVGDMVWQPFSCDISSEGNTLRIVAGKAALCGISTPGTVEISPGKVDLHIVPIAKGKSLTETIDCLTKESIKTSGTFDFKGDIKGKGTGETLVQTLNGPIHFVSKKGRIDRFGLLMQIFSLLNITEIFGGQLPDLKSQGFAYHSITVDGHLKEGRLELTSALLDAPSMNIACTGHIDLLKETLELTVFAAPFKMVDRILRMLPVVGYVMDYTLVSIAIKVTGDVKNPKVDYLPVSSLGSGILGIMKRTLKAPVKVLTPMIPK